MTSNYFSSFSVFVFFFQIHSIMPIEQRNKKQWACIQGSWDNDGEKSPTQEHHCCVLWATPGNLVILYCTQWTVFYWLKRKILKPPGWSLLCKTKDSNNFDSLSWENSLFFIFYSLHITLKTLNRLALWLARKDENLEAMLCTASSMDCTEALKENQGFAS